MVAEVSNNVGLFFAKDIYENIILINEINDFNKANKYVCPICGTQIKPRAIESEKVSPHFYHVNATEHTSESILHWWCKNKYMVAGDRFCIEFDGVKYEYICKDIFIEKAHITSTGLYIPDVTVNTTSGDTIFFEYNYTNKKSSDDYAEKWIELGFHVVEINIRNLMASSEMVFSPIFFDGIVLCTSKSERYSIIQKHIDDNVISDRIRIKYLNGFLRDVLRYSNDDLDIDDMVVIIDSMNDCDKIYIPKLLKRLSCTTLLDDYSNYKLRNVEDVLRVKLLENNLKYDDYSWIVSLGYSQKWTKCRGAKFNNTLFVNGYTYHNDYNYNRTRYNKSINGEDVFFIDSEKVSQLIDKTISKEITRRNNINAKAISEHIKQQRLYIYQSICNNLMNEYDDIILCANTGSWYDMDSIVIDIKSDKYLANSKFKYYIHEINNYKGTGRLSRFVNDIKSEISRLEKYWELKKEKDRGLNVLRRNKSKLCKDVSETIKFEVDVEMDISGITISDVTRNFEFEFNLDSIVIDGDTILHDYSDYICKIKSLILHEIDCMNSIDYAERLICELDEKRMCSSIYCKICDYNMMKSIQFYSIGSSKKVNILRVSLEINLFNMEVSYIYNNYTTKCVCTDYLQIVRIINHVTNRLKYIK